MRGALSCASRLGNGSGNPGLFCFSSNGGAIRVMAMDRKHLKSLVPQSVYDYLSTWSQGVQAVLGDKLIGAYLTGSLTYGDFVETRSDIDLAAVVTMPLSQEDLLRVRALHLSLERENPLWRERVECSYIPANLLPNVLPPKTPRPWWGIGVLYETAPYGNEWIINQYFLWKCSVPLVGPQFNTLVRHVDIRDVQQASARDLFQEWAPKLGDLEWLENPHYQSYLILNICRILYAVLTAEAGSKSTAAAWVKRTFPAWRNLIEIAQNWRYGDPMDHIDEATGFIRFAIDEVTASVIL